ncbi:saccharopine dehydrogenase NADP-binding domain-containing protein [Nocardia amikacinitolerans]|uniref:saccharopine dehydrogenase NADP-binding domain-containing protein n=1 Tax=Nocardia amikacinitolerans TaxID=756689 RepID=UPI0020A34778|nr:saccharopine dehydrogenase NADP-binding domain-containing protein [Nocardia amikacinitolerans]MCP2293000.1 Saccharopine dehydrogenase NADP binding domain-containing protein [Nocardia amikacinitolerans]
MTVVILGGYGAVGREAAAALVAAGQRVRLVGRRPERARAVDGAEMVRADIADDRQLAEVLDDASVVLMCAELDNARVARACFERGVHYLDVSASHGVLGGIEELDDLAVAHDAVGVLSVGLIPGVSNLLARRVVEVSGGRTVRIGAVLGSGEAHGPAALRWTLDGLGTMSGSWRMTFPEGGRVVHRFPFSDQYTLVHTLGIDEARTGLALDSRPLTWLIGAARRPLLARLMRGRVVEWLLARVHVGSERFAVVAESGATSAWFAGHRQSHATGLVAALLVRRVESFPAGVRHIDQLVELGEFLAELDAYGFESHLPE